MLELLVFGGIEVPQNPLIEVVTENRIEIIVEPELTVQEKIDSNHYNCDEAVEWIRADTAECITKPVYVAPVAENTSKTIKSSSQSKSTAPSGYYAWNQCTGYVASRRAVGQWNNASQWYWQAQRDGWATGTTPQAGAIGVAYGNHVVYIERVDGSRVYISERNYDYRGSYRERWTDASNYRYIY